MKESWGKEKIHFLWCCYGLQLIPFKFFVSCKWRQDFLFFFGSWVVLLGLFQAEKKPRRVIYICPQITLQSVRFMVLNLKYPDPNEDLHCKSKPNTCALKLPRCWALQETEQESIRPEPLQFLESHRDNVQTTLNRKRDFCREKGGLCGIMWLYSTDEILKPFCETVHWKWRFRQLPRHMLS